MGNRRVIFHYEGRWDRWGLDPEKGVILEIDGKFFLHGTKLSEKPKWPVHPPGIIIPIGNKILLDGKILLYEGSWDSWSPCENGVVIQKNQDWIFCEIPQLPKFNVSFLN